MFVGRIVLIRACKLYDLNNYRNRSLIRFNFDTHSVLYYIIHVQ